MEYSFAVDCIYAAQLLTCCDLVALLHINALYLGIQSEIIAVLDKNTLMVSGKYGNLRHGPVEYGLHVSVLRNSYGNTIVLRQGQRLEY